MPSITTNVGRIAIRVYNVEIGGGNAFAMFDGAELPTVGERQHVNHLALPWARLRNLTKSVWFRGMRWPHHSLRNEERGRVVLSAQNLGDGHDRTYDSSDGGGCFVGRL